MQEIQNLDFYIWRQGEKNLLELDWKKQWEAEGSWEECMQGKGEPISP